MRGWAIQVCHVATPWKEQNVLVKLLPRLQPAGSNLNAPALGLGHFLPVCLLNHTEN